MGLRILFVRVEQSPGFEQWTPFSSGFLVLFSHKKEKNPATIAAAAEVAAALLSAKEEF